MRALWSFWSKPMAGEKHSPWFSLFHHMLSWALSFETGRKYFSETALVTDDEGARLLIDRLGLAFSSVSTSLNEFEKCDPHWWALGKLHAYSIQENPFVHIDSDVYLWKGLPEKMTSASILSQNPEHFYLGESWYHPEKFESIKNAGGWVPREIDWFLSLGPMQKGECCGIFGGHNLDFIHYYSENAKKLILEPENYKTWYRLGADNILVEQYYLSACYEYFRNYPNNRFGPLDMAYLFNNSEQAFMPEAAEKAGYTHLIGGAKKNQSLMKRLRTRVERDHPLLYDSCLRHFQNK